MKSVYREERKGREDFKKVFLAILARFAVQKELNMTINDQYNKWKESILKRSLDKTPERKPRFETTAGIELPRLSLPGGLDTSREQHAGLLDHQELILQPFLFIFILRW